MTQNKKLCDVCGARLTNWTQTTCDNVCTRAKSSSLTRGQQMFYDIRHIRFPSEPYWRPPDALAKDNIDYNRPYLRENYA